MTTYTLFDDIEEFGAAPWYVPRNQTFIAWDAPGTVQAAYPLVPLGSKILIMTNGKIVAINPAVEE